MLCEGGVQAGEAKRQWARFPGSLGWESHVLLQTRGVSRGSIIMCLLRLPKFGVEGGRSDVSRTWGGGGCQLANGGMLFLALSLADLGAQCSCDCALSHHFACCSSAVAALPTFLRSQQADTTVDAHTQATDRVSKCVAEQPMNCAKGRRTSISHLPAQ